MNYKIAFVGNPNVGKTSIYNQITHSFEHVGNWHGVTVSAISKNVVYEDNQITVTDLPGLYSLTVYSPEEGVSRDVIYSKTQNVIIDVCEVGNFARNLYLTLQMLEAGAPVIIALSMMDELRRAGKIFDYQRLEKTLGIKVLPLDVKKREEKNRILSFALDYIKSSRQNSGNLKYLDSLPVNEIQSIISSNAAVCGLQARHAAIKVMEKDDYIIAKLRLTPDQEKAIEVFGDCREKLAAARYDYIDEITDGLISYTEEKKKKIHKNKDVKTGFNGIDRIVLNKYLALPIFFAIMALIFIVTFGDYFPGYWMKSGLEWFFENCLHNPIVNGLNMVGAWDWVTGLVADGVINGVGGVLVFLPQIALLFLFLAILEDSGYISRVAFMTDGLFRKIGLSGKSVFTMLMGFGCSATAVLTARGLEDENMRKKTVLLTPFMSCSARFPIYSAICAAYFAPGKAFVILGMYLLGVAIAISFAAVLNKIKKLKSGNMSFIMEMPPYRFPTFTRVVQVLWHNSKAFIVRVGTVVFALNVIVWLLSDFGIGQVNGNWVFGYVGAYDEGVIKSFLEYFASAVSVLFAPIGFGSGANGWKAVTALISGLVAKEVVLASIESFGGVTAVFGANAPAALAFVVFSLLYIPCIATITAIKKEAGTKWMLASISIQLLTAYVVALIFYWLGVLFSNYLGIGISIVALVLIALSVVLIIRRVVTRKNNGCALCGMSSVCNKTTCNKG